MELAQRAESIAGRGPVIAFAAGIVAGAAWLGAAYLALGRGFAFPLERPYVLLQEARALTDGTLPPAEDGLLWQLLLLPGVRLAGGAHALVWTSAVAVALLGFLSLFAFLLAGRVSPRLAPAATALVLASGWTLYGALSGTEVALAAAALLAAAWALAAGRAWSAGTALAAFALAVPWGAGPALVVALVAAALNLRRGSLHLAAPLALPVGAFAWVTVRGGLSVLYEPDPATSVLRLHGAPFASRVSDWLGEASAGISAAAVADSRFLVPVVLAALAGLGVALLARHSPSCAALAGTAALAAALAAGTSGWAQDGARVLAVVAPLAAATAAAGLGALPSGARVPGAAGLVALALVPLPGWWGDAVLGSSHLLRVQIPFARESAANMAPGSRVAVDRPGVFGFYVPVALDLSGRQTELFREPAGAGLGAVWEALVELPPEEAPELFAVSLDRTQLGPTSLVGQTFIERRIPAEETGRAQDTVTALALIGAAWDAVPDAELLPPGQGAEGQVAVDVGDLADERAAGYERSFGLENPDRSAAVSLETRASEPGAAERLSEGCRLVARERFEVEVGPGSRLVGRFAGQAAVAAAVDGDPAGSLRADDAGDAYAYGSVSLTGVLPGRHVVELASSTGEAYTSCRYWLAR
jgi:hypothetical protein